MELTKPEVAIVGKSTLNTIHIALISVWTALILACALLIIYPVPGTDIWITLASPLFACLTAPLLGPLGGTISGLIFGLAVPYVNPATGGLGALTFLAPTLGALISSLVLFNRWKEATLIFICEVAIWFAHPFAWYQFMPIVTWGYWLSLIFIVVPPIRKWIIDSIIFRDARRLPVALWCIAWLSRVGGDTITGNNIAVWILGWTYDMYAYWAPMTIYYAIADFLTCLAGAVVGTSILLALKTSGTKITAIDMFEPLWKAKRSK